MSALKEIEQKKVKVEKRGAERERERGQITKTNTLK